MSKPDESYSTHSWPLICFIFIVRMMTVDSKIKTEFVTPPVEHGDSPFWSQGTKSVYFVDRTGGTINRYDSVANKFHSTAIVDFKELSFIVPIEGHVNTFAVGIGMDIGIYVWDGLSEEPINTDIKLPVTSENNLIYTGKTDANGRLWVVTQLGTLFLVYPEKTVVKMQTDEGSFTGMAWSSSGTKFFRAKADPRGIMQYDFDLVQGIINVDSASLLVDFTIDKNFTHSPLGLTITDVENILLVTFSNFYLVFRISSNDGGNYGLYFLNASITSTVFGGENLDELYATTVKTETLANSGCLFRLIGVSGKGLAGIEAKIQV